MLVLLHGVSSNLTRWSEFVAQTSLRGSWDLLRIDLRGNGRSAYRGRIGMVQWCSDLAAILAAEGYARAVVAGHCLGANIAIEFAARHPDKAAGLILIEPMFREALTGTMARIAAFRPLFVPVAGLIRGLNSLGVHRRRLMPLDLEALDRETRATIASAGHHEALVRRYASPLLDLRTTPSAAYLQALIAVTGRLPDLSKIRIPVLALLSTASTFSDPDITERGLAALEARRVERLPARHWIPTEQPEAMRRAIERWCGELR
ncbi:MAG TPA: alpha/beta hydrolase [Methylomirabilota bacterium]|nr:alpha/beta hydrolase [Methylomirabilota bacterium]